MDYAGVAIPMQYFPCFLFKSTWLISQDGKQSFKRPMKSWQGPRSVKWKSWVPNWACVAPKGENSLVSWAQIPSGALEEGSVWRRVSDGRSHSKDGAEPAGPEGFQEPGSTGPKQPHVFRRTPFCFAFCLSGGDISRWGRSQPEIPPLLRHTDPVQ